MAVTSSESVRSSLVASGDQTREPVAAQALAHANVVRRRLLRRIVVTDTVGVVLAALAAVALAGNGTLTLMAADSIGAAIAGGTAAAVWLAGLIWARQRDIGVAIGGAVRPGAALLAGLAAFAVCCIALSVVGIVAPLALLVLPFLIGTIGVWTGRRYQQAWLRSERSQGRCLRTVLLVGDSRQLGDLGRVLRTNGSGVRIVGACVTDSEPPTDVLIESTAGSDAGITTVPVFGSADRLLDIAGELAVDTVIVGPSAPVKSIGALSWDLDKLGASLATVSRTADIDRERLKNERLGFISLVHVVRPTYRRATGAVKRSVDLLGSIALLLVGALPMLGIALAIRVTSRGPALFTQPRAGLNGKHFTMFKFRSMVADAEDRLDDLQLMQDAGNDVMFKMKSDPRVTRIGQLLRRLSLDELPQLLNVLRGDMSLVGPRPPLFSEVASYDDVAMRRFLVKPGMTGLWQVSGRSELTWDQTMQCDRRYVENWSIAGDLSILGRTASAMRNGAY